MKKKLIGVFALSIGLLLVSCGDAATDTDADAEGDGTENNEGGGAEPAAEIEVSSEMLAFIGDFNGEAEVVEDALILWGANDDVIDHDMGMYNLEEPRVTAQNGDCYTLVCKSGMVENTYEICWEDEEIVSITGG